MASWRRVAHWLEPGLPPIALALVVAVLLLFDWLSRQAGNTVVPGGPVDETAHIATALLALGTISPAARRRFLLPALIASFAIDVDHVPGSLGIDWLTRGTPRPYTHSLLTIAVVLALTWLWRKRRDVLLGVAIGLALHFLRDLGEGGAGVSLLWPFSHHVFWIAHARYLELCAGFAVVAGLRYQVEIRAQRAGRRRSGAAEGIGAGP